MIADPYVKILLAMGSVSAIACAGDPEPSSPTGAAATGGSGAQSGGAGAGANPGTGGAGATGGGSGAMGGAGTGGGGASTGSGGDSGGWTGNGIYVDHQSVALFEQIPDNYLQAARETTMLFSDRSVGQNINEALDCLTATSWASSPSACRRDYYDAAWSWKTFTQADLDAGAVPAQILFAPDPDKYDRSNWVFEFKTGGWSELTQDFIEVLGPAYVGSADVLGYQFSYLNVDGASNIADPSTGFFADTGSYDVHDLEAFIAQHPSEVFIFWTASLARGIGTQVSTDFNEAMRAYAQANDKILFDVAAIESHTHAGEPCYDNRDGVEYCTGGGNCENHPDDGLLLPAICQDYTTETEGGHLGSVSGAKIRIAKAFWVLMAQIAGWRP